MKLTTVIIAASAAVILPASAVQYSLAGSNFTDAVSDTAITLNDGTPIGAGAGFVGVGSFSSVPGGPGDVAGSFNVLVSGTMDATALIGVGLPGFYNFSGDTDSADAKVISAGDQDVFLVFGNNNDLGAATEVGVVQITGKSFESAFAGPGPFSLTGLSVAGSTPIIGAFGDGVTVSDGTNSAPVAATFRLAVIPEPSSALLLGFAGLGLLIRRKR